MPKLEMADDASDALEAAQAEIAKLRRQRTALCRFGGRALTTDDLDPLLTEAAELISEALDVDLVKVLEHLPAEDTLLLRAGVNWKPGVVGKTRLGTHRSSPGGYALQTTEPVVSEDIATETRFEIPELLVEHGVRSMINVLIKGDQPAWGVLEVDARQRRAFGEDDIAFLQNYANLLSAAIGRLALHRQLTEAAERQEILLGELRHRDRNMLENVRSLARRTQRTSGDLDSFAAAFEARLSALDRAQDLLARGAQARIDLREVLRRELEAHGVEEGPRILCEGPEMPLSPQAAQALGMAFHELATNASKYGALAHEGGRIAVTWSRAQAAAPAARGANDRAGVAAGAFVRWRETGVPIPEQPPRQGFGSETIKRGVPHMLGGDATLRYHPDGVECTIRFPV